MRLLSTAVLVSLALLLTTGCRTEKLETSNAETDALFRAARAGSDDVVRTLLASPTIVVDAADKDGNTALLEAARNGHEDVVQLLLIAKADPKHVNKAGKTALMLASEGGHEESVRILRGAVQ